MQPATDVQAKVRRVHRPGRGHAFWVAGLLFFALPAEPRPAQVLALDALKELPVKGRAPKTGYTRAEFGHAWADEDHNGCDTRNDILHRDLTATAVKPGTRNCVILTGTLMDPYSGEAIRFERGPNSAEIQIDHVVALSNAWQTGAFQFAPEKRQAMANDPLNLLAALGRLNSQKGDGDAATWLPPRKTYRCAYVARQVAVKRKYQLWVTPPEHDAIARGDLPWAADSVNRAAGRATDNRSASARRPASARL